MVVEGYQKVCPMSGPDFRAREDNLWMVNAGTLVLGMNAAFGLLEAGCVRNRNVLNIMMKNISDMTLGGVIWWVCGYTIAFQVGSDEKWPVSVYDESFWFFQWTFAATAATIDSGAIAERVNFLSYVLMSCLTTGVVYPIAVSWVWTSEGYLAALGFLDFAGGAVVHMLGACSALCCCYVVGPRIGRFPDYIPSWGWVVRNVCVRPSDADYYVMPAGQKQIIAVTDAVSLVWGVFFLWIGWYGFNPGGVPDIEFGGAYVMGRVVVNTTLGALGGGFANFLVMLFVNGGKAYAEGFALGVLAGLVGITAGCLWFGNGDCYLIGTLAAFLGEAVRRLLAWAWIDDVVTAIPVHGLPGAFGTVMIPFYAQYYSCNPGGPIGLFYAKAGQETDDAWHLVSIQIWGCVVIGFWAFWSTFLTIIMINKVPLLAPICPALKGFELRLDRGHELKGLDEVEHDMTHDSEDFVEIVKHFFALLSKHSTEDCETRVKNASTEALKCLSFSHHMEEFAHNRVHRKCDFKLLVKDIKVRGLNNTSGVSGCMTGCAGNKFHMIVEVVSAVRLEDCFMRDFNYFAPRFAALASVDTSNKECKFAGEFLFEDFYVPPGSEESTFVCLTLVMGGVVFAQAHLPFMNAGWAPIQQDATKGIEAFPQADLAFLKQAQASAHPDPVTCHVCFQCPVKPEVRRGSQITRIICADKKFRGSLHHSGQLNVAELERRISVSEQDKGATTMDKLLNDATKAEGGEYAKGEARKELKSMSDDCKALLEDIKKFQLSTQNNTTSVTDTTNAAPRQARAVGHTNYMTSK